MPTITINLKYFNSLVKHEFSLSELNDLCFNFGLEVEEDTNDKDQIKVEVPANRYDLLCVEGLALTISNYVYA